tara:strand:+ start:2221 stop:2499 length:279 start_codon:yes stop_codon:yes gene_type:complete
MSNNKYNSRTDRLLYYNYELKFKNCEWKKYVFREQMIADYGLSKGSIAQLCNDNKLHGKTSPRRYKWADYQIRFIHEKRGCLIKEEKKLILF